uniref:YqeG family HAD IIIA-type phosphatase n=1 Tax=Staphylococcus aureus TaxID=1280 RepID=UPI003F5B442A
MGLVRKFFMPNSYVQSIFQIDLDKLVDKGVKGIITDLDNTLVGWDVKEPTERVKAWFKEANENGITITIVPNINESSVASFSQLLDIDFIFKGRKSLGKACGRARTR